METSYQFQRTWIITRIPVNLVRGSNSIRWLRNNYYSTKKCSDSPERRLPATPTPEPMPSLVAKGPPPGDGPTRHSRRHRSAPSLPLRRSSRSAAAATPSSRGDGRGNAASPPPPLPSRRRAGGTAEGTPPRCRRRHAAEPGDRPPPDPDTHAPPSPPPP